MFANSMMATMNLGFPDVCKTPVGPAVTPVPYPNISETSNALPTVPNILLAGTPAQNLASIVPLSTGDSTGVLGGVVSQTEMGMTRPTTGAFTILYDGMPATRLTSINAQNMNNCVGVSITPSQFTVVLLSA